MEYTIYDIDWRLLNSYHIAMSENDHPLHDSYVNNLSKYIAFVQERMDIDYDIKRKALDRVKQQQYEELIRLNNLKEPNQLQKDIQAARLSLGEKVESQNRPYIWLCVNPNSTYSFKDFQLLVSKALSKLWIKEYVYVFEQRGITEEEAGKGFHLHAIIKRPDDKKPSHCVREFANTFKKCCDTSNFHFFQVKFIDVDEKDRKMEYILGEKQSTAENQKDIKQVIDKIWRSKINIQPYFFSNIELGKYAISA